MQVGDHVRCEGECRRIVTIDGDVFTTAKVPPPRKLRVPIFGATPVPFGRRADILAALPPSIDRTALAWVEANPRDVFGGDWLYLFGSRLALVIARDTTAGQRKYSPAVRQL